MFSLSFNIGGLSLPQLKSKLKQNDIGLNPSAEKLLTDPRLIISSKSQLITLQVMPVAALHLTKPATLPNILGAAQEQGFKLCSLEMALYCRLFWKDQPVSNDNVMYRHKAPDSSVTIASQVITSAVDQPKGFYLRNVNQKLWLRGYICDDDFIWNPNDLFAFQK